MIKPCLKMMTLSSQLKPSPLTPLSLVGGLELSPAWHVPSDDRLNINKAGSSYPGRVLEASKGTEG